MKWISAQQLFWLRVAIFSLGAAGLAFLVSSSALEKGISAESRALLILIGLAAAFAFWKVTPGVPRSFNQKGWMRPKTPALVMSVVLNIISVLSMAVSMVAPRAAIESKAGRIEAQGDQNLAIGKSVQRDLGEVKGALAIGSAALIRGQINGTWGEIGCQVTYRFFLRDRALVVETLKSQAGMKTARWVFTIESESDLPGAAGARHSMFSTSESQGLHLGQSVKFYFATNGVTRSLSWNGENPAQNNLELVPCEDKA